MSMGLSVCGNVKLHLRSLCGISGLGRLVGCLVFTRWSLLFRWFPTGSTRDNHRHHAAFHYWGAFNRDSTFQHLGNFVQQLATKIRVAHLSSTKLNAYAYFVAVSQEFL